jgi:hypothetical protein
VNAAGHVSECAPMMHDQRSDLTWSNCQWLYSSSIGHASNLSEAVSAISVLQGVSLARAGESSDATMLGSLHDWVKSTSHHNPSSKPCALTPGQGMCPFSKSADHDSPRPECRFLGAPKGFGLSAGAHTAIEQVAALLNIKGGLLSDACPEHLVDSSLFSTVLTELPLVYPGCSIYICTCKGPFLTDFIAVMTGVTVTSASSADTQATSRLAFAAGG